MDIKIFYSWQSDLPNSTNRSFIQKAIENVVKAIHKDNSIEVVPVIDRDTLGISGTPNIPQTILEKISKSDIFVCDVSIINAGSKFRFTPNPNVLFELGYALNKFGWDRIIMVINEAFGSINKLPFDLEKRRCISYIIQKDSKEKANERKKLESLLTNSIKSILDNLVAKENETKLSPVPLDKKTIYGYIAGSPRVRELDKKLAKFYGLPLDTININSIRLLEQAKNLGINNLAELDDAVKTHCELAFHLAYFQTPEKKLYSGHSVQVVFDVMIAQLGTPERVNAFYNSLKHTSGWGVHVLEMYEQALLFHRQSKS